MSDECKNCLILEKKFETLSEKFQISLDTISKYEKIVKILIGILDDHFEKVEKIIKFIEN